MVRIRLSWEKKKEIKVIWICCFPLFSLLSQLSHHTNNTTTYKSIKPNIHNAIWSQTIYKLQRVHCKIIWSYVTYDMSYRIELLSIPYNVTKSYATKSQRVYWAL